MRLYRPKHKDLPEPERVRANARAYANVYQRRGKLEKWPCQECADPDSQKHHDDYGKPLQVAWVCKEHHAAIHADERLKKTLADIRAQVLGKAV